MAVLKIEKGMKEYNKKDKRISILENINISFEKNKLYAIIGHSGSGKTTLLQILGLISSLTKGNYFIEEENVSNLNENQKAEMRMKKIGFVFQEFYLNSKLNAIENVMLPTYINKEYNNKSRKQVAAELLEKLGLKDRIYHFPKELSGGEKQRVGIARALINNPDLILADEPTGNLDAESEKQILEMLKELSYQSKCVIVVSHSQEIKQYADEILKIENKMIKNVNDEL